MALIHSNIRALRKKLSLTQDQLASRLNVKRSAIGSYEEERARPAIDLMLQMAKIFSVSVDELVNIDYSKAQYISHINQTSGNKNWENIEPQQVEITAPEQLSFIDKPEAVIAMPILPKVDFNVEKENHSNKQIGIPYITTSNITAYIQSHDSQSFIGSLPQITLGHLNIKNAFAFEAQADFPLKNSVIIARKLTESESIENGQHYLIISKNGSILFRRVFDLLQIKGCYLLSSDSLQIPSAEIPQNEVLKILKFESYISSELPKSQVLSPKIKNLLEELGREIEKSGI